MELWSAGFNAWGQLNFDGESSFDSEDFTQFTRVLEVDEIEGLRTSLSSTLGKSRLFNLLGSRTPLLNYMNFTRYNI